MNEEKQLPEGTKIRDKCGWTTCNHLAFFEDWTGNKYCFYHIYYTWRWSGGNKWFGFKHIKLHFPKSRIVKYYNASSTPLSTNNSVWKKNYKK